MTAPDEIQSLSDAELLSRLSRFVKQSRHVESVLVAHLAEVDERRLYAREGSPSMFKYCVDVLHLSEAEAYRRIAAARASRRYPLILEMLADGRIHLAGISVLKKHLTDANHKDVLSKASHKTKEEIELLVASLAPKPDVPPTIRKRPQRKSKTDSPKSKSSTELCRGTVGQPELKPRPAKPERPPAVEPLASARYKVEFTASAELRDKFKRLEALMPGNDLGTLIDAAVTEKLERLEAKRYGKVNKPRKNLEDADITPGVRGISAPVRRFVWERDGGQCTFVSKKGRRCPERRWLEFHHEDPFALGGDRSAGNIRLLCKAHNMHMAERDYGRDWIERYRSQPASTLSGPNSARDGPGSPSC